MHVIIFSDVHGNLPALELMLKNEKQADLFISLGDIVNYAPWSNECVQLLETIPNIVKLKGNHEDAYIKGIYNGSHIVAKSFFNICFPSFSELENISNYKNDYALQGFKFIHTIDDSYIFADTNIALKEHTVLGHSHKQFVTEKGGFMLINPGSIGQNRSFINVSDYIVWNTVTNTFTCKHNIYNIDFIINEMHIRNYPQICIDYYQNKKRYE